MELKKYTAISSALPAGIWAAAAMHASRKAILSGHPDDAIEPLKMAIHDLEEALQSRGRKSGLNGMEEALLASVRSLWAVALHKSGLPDDVTLEAGRQAKEGFERAFSDKEGPAGSFLTDYVILLAEFQQIDEALATLQKDGDVVTAAGYRQIAEALMARKRYEEAVSVLRRAVALQPRPEVFDDLGEAQEGNGKPGPAFLSYMQAAGLSIIEGELDDALGYAEEGLRVQPLDPDALSIRGALKWRRGDLAGALQDFYQLAKLRPDDPKVCTALARVLLQNAEPEKALAYLMPALVREPENSDALWLQAEALLAIGDEDARAGDLGRAAGYWKNARESCTRSLAGGPKNRASRRTLAKLCCRLGEFEQALEKLREVLAGHPTDVQAVACRAEALLGVGLAEEALSAVNTALALDTDGEAGWLRALRAKILARYPDGQADAPAALEDALRAGSADYPTFVDIAKLLRSQKKWIDLALLSRKMQDPESDSRFYAEYRKEEVASLRNASEYEAALEAVEREPPLPTDESGARWLRARLLADIGDFEAAETLVNPAAPQVDEQLDTKAGSALDQLSLRGWIVQNEEPADQQERLLHAHRCVEYYSRALDLMERPNLDPTFAQQRVWVRKGLANSLLRIPERVRHAHDEYKRVIIECEKEIALARKANPLTFCLMGWCYYSLEDYSMASRFYSRAKGEDFNSPAVDMDFGLVLLASGSEAAPKMYQAALQKADKEDVIRKIGLVRVALHDIRELLFRHPELIECETVSEVRQVLRVELEKTLNRLEGRWSRFGARLRSIVPRLLSPPNDTSARVSSV